MAEPYKTMDAASTYETLADAHERRNEPRPRDIFLALAADAHATSGRPGEAERVRQKLLRHSPYHLLKPYTSFTEALHSPDVNDYLGDLRQQFPPDVALRLLHDLTGGTAPTAPALPGSPTPLQAPRPTPSQPRRAAVSPYAATVPLPLPARPEAPTLTWVPGLLALIVVLLALAWGLFVFVGPFLE